MYNSKYSFHKYYRDNKKFDKLSFKSKYSFLDNFFNDLDKLSEIKSQKKKTEKKKEIYIILLESYIMIYQECILMNIMNYQMLKEIKWSTSMILLNFCLEKYNSDNWFQKEESTNKKGLKILATNKLLTNQYY